MLPNYILFRFYFDNCDCCGLCYYPWNYINNLNLLIVLMCRILEKLGLELEEKSQTSSLKKLLSKDNRNEGDLEHEELLIGLKKTPHLELKNNLSEAQ